LVVIPPFARATVVLPQAVMQMQLQLDLCPQPLLLQETLKVENSPDRGWSAVSMQ
jgi:hypothetical protein